MKRFELFFTFIQLPIDYLMLVAGGLSAFGLRYTEFITAIRPVQFNLQWQNYWPVVLWVALGWVAIFALSGLYQPNPNRKFAKDLTRIVLACSTGFAAITIYVFFTFTKFDSRFLVLAGWLLAIVFVFAGRLFTRGLKSILHRFGIGLRRVVIIGQEDIAKTIAETIKLQKRFGLELAGTFQNFNAANLSEIASLKPDELIFTNPRAHVKETLMAIDFANQNHVTFKYSADLFATLSSNISVSTLSGIPIIELRRTRLSAWGRIVKRGVDIIGSLFFLALFSPLFLIISIIILLETGRPVIYKNERIGQYNKRFVTYKFRSMYQKDSTGSQFGDSGEEALKREAELIKTNSIKSGPVYKIANDPRVTPFGRFLRRWSLDELPNFWNVLKGDMSLVGPRPHQPREVEQYDKEHSILLSIKPGITGMSQISGRSNLTFEEEAKLDTFYIENWNLYLDGIILTKTPFVVLTKKGAV